MYAPRTLESYLEAASRQFPALLVCGARQVGKTTLLRHLAGPDRTYVSLDDPLVLSLAKTDPALFLQRFAPPLIIDEIQYAPELLPYIKLAADRSRTPGLFWLTGSQHFHVMKGVSESLAGRVAVVTLLGLARRESAGLAPDVPPFLPGPEELRPRLASGAPLPLPELYRLIWRGAFPAVALNDEMDRDLFYASYVQTYLQRDVRDLARVGDEMAFLRFLRACAARTAQILNMAELARDADIAPNTAKHWLSILEASGVVYLLEPYHSNVTKRLVKAPKIYILDTGLCAYLTQWTSPATLADGAMAGPILETWVMGELLKSYHHHGLQAPFHYFRDKDGREIDLVIVRDGTAYPVEIKRTATPGRDDVRHFPSLERLGLPVGPGGLICLAEQHLPLAPNVLAIPAWAI